MLRRPFIILLALVFITQVSASPSPTPTTEGVIETMGAPDLQQVIQLLKANYLKPDELNETELARATLLGLLDRIGPGVMLLPEHAPAPNETNNAIYAEMIEGHIGYLRPGTLNAANLQALDGHLQNMRTQKADAAVLDLRASAGTNDFALAAEFAKRFLSKGKPLFALRRPGSAQNRVFTNDREPAYSGLLIILVDSETSGPAEALAATLRFNDKALVIGAPTAGQPVEFSDLPLNGGRLLRVAVAEAVLPDGQSLYPGGVKPDLPVEMSVADKRSVFQQSVEKGMAPFVFEKERPHLNEAALLAGRNPDIEAAEAAQQKRNGLEKPNLRDRVLQRAIDVVTSLQIYHDR